jgi:hypothetical protein
MEEIKTKIFEAIQTKKINVESAVDVLGYLMQEADKLNSLNGDEKKTIVISILSDLAKGDDGITGTSDDILSPDVIKGINAMIDNNLVSCLINVLIDASKGNLDLNKYKNLQTTKLINIANISNILTSITSVTSIINNIRSMLTTCLYNKNK